MLVSQRVQIIKPSPTLSISARAQKLQAEGQDIVNLSLGEPDFDTPDHIKEAAIRALKNGMTKYTAVDGIAPLKQAVIDKFARDNQLIYGPSEVIIANGCKQNLFNAMVALLNEGDEVIIPAPYWVSYPDMVLLAGGIPKTINTHYDQQFKITAEQLNNAITPYTKLLVLNSPTNPSGMAYTEQELQSLAETLLKHPHVFIISDDIYEHIYWHPHPFKNILNICPALRNRTIICHGVSKTYAMTGWRIGFAAGPQAIIKAMVNVQSQSTSGANAMAQHAAAAALTGDQQCVIDMCRAYQQRHALLYQAVNAIPGLKCHPANGTFYSFIDVSQAMKTWGNFQTDLAFSEYLLTTAGVVVVPGSAFGTPNCIRLSYATSETLLKQAIHRLQNVAKP